MDFVKIKNMVRENGDKVIFMEHGEPELVVMSFAEYEKLARLQFQDERGSSIRPSSVPPTPGPKAQKSDEDIMHETEFITPIETAPIRSASVNGYGRIAELARGESPRAADIRLEDLPI